MQNPLELYIKAFWPKNKTLSDELNIHYRVLLCFCAMSKAVMVYSIVKWVAQDSMALVGTSCFGLLLSTVAALAVRFGVSAVSVANIFLFGAFPHGINMVYQLGGLDSAHIYWFPVLIVVAFLIANRRSGFFWCSATIKMTG